jgi:hypothetical protein
VLLTSKYGNMGPVNWSPDGKWLAYARPDQSRVSNIYMIPAAGGQEHKVTFGHGAASVSRVFRRTGRNCISSAMRGAELGGAVVVEAAVRVATGRRFFVRGRSRLERQDKDPENPEERAETGRQCGTQGPSVAEDAAQRVTRLPLHQPVKEANIDWGRYQTAHLWL